MSIAKVSKAGLGIRAGKIIVASIVAMQMLVGVTAVSASSNNSNKVSKIEIKRGGQSVSSIQAKLGDPSIALSVEIKPKKAASQPIGWTSSNTSVAIVNNSGKVIMYGAGDTTITATALDGFGRSDSVVVHVAASGSSYTSNDVLPDHNDGANNEINDFLGVTLINPQYHFGEEDGLVEGGQRLLELNTKSIKLYLSPNYRQFYQFTDWGTNPYTSPTQLAQAQSFQTVFDMDFNTYFLGTFSFTEPKYATYWIDGFTAAQKQQEYDQIYDLAYYLLTTYAGTNKSFILQNWEGDWSTMLAPDPATDPSDDVLNRLTEWINIRQNAVNDARIAANRSGVHVYNALEVNLVKKAMNGGKTLTNNVIPNTYCDYYSYSAYDTVLDGRVVYGNALDYLRSKVAQNLNNGNSRVFVGEFGLPENSFGTKQVMNVIKMVTEVSREKQIDHIVHWQLYDNECTVSPVQTDQDCRGYWLIRPSGKKTAMWNYFYEQTHNGTSDPEYVPDPPAEYAALEITLGAVNVEQGLKQVQATDGLTTVATVGGVESRVTPGASPNLYMYFSADHDFITPDNAAIDIEVTYYDQGVSPLVLEYNSKTYVASSKQIARTNTNQWLTHTFKLTDAKFESGLSGVADFRFNDWNDPLYISKVKVSKPGPVETVYATVDLGGAANVENGLAAPVLGDGTPVKVTMGGIEALGTNTAAGLHNLYFDVDAAIIPSDASTVKIEVSYYDSGSTGFVLRYNSSDPNGTPFQHSKDTAAVMFTNTNSWLTHTFTITDAELDNTLYGLVDFYLTSDNDNIYIDTVKAWVPVQERSEISIFLRTSPLEDGISLKQLGYDGVALPATIGGKDAMATDPTNTNNPDRANNNFMYFDADDLFVPDTQQMLEIDVTYYDAGTSPFELQYNSTLSDDPPSYLGLVTPISVNRTGTDQWLTHTFQLDNAEFANKLQGGLADFRLSDKGDKLYVNKITIRKPAQQ